MGTTAARIGHSKVTSDFSNKDFDDLPEDEDWEAAVRDTNTVTEPVVASSGSGRGRGRAVAGRGRGRKGRGGQARVGASGCSDRVVSSGMLSDPVKKNYKLKVPETLSFILLVHELSNSYLEDSLISHIHDHNLNLEKFGYVRSQVIPLSISLFLSLSVSRSLSISYPVTSNCSP